MNHEQLPTMIIGLKQGFIQNDHEERASVLSVRIASARETIAQIPGYPHMRTRVAIEAVDLELTIPHRATRGELATMLEDFAAKLRDPET